MKTSDSSLPQYSTTGITPIHQLRNSRDIVLTTMIVCHYEKERSNTNSTNNCLTYPESSQLIGCLVPHFYWQMREYGGQVTESLVDSPLENAVILRFQFTGTLQHIQETEERVFELVYKN